MASKLRIRLVQGNPVVGDLLGNSQKIKDFVSESKEVDLLVFPECFLTGYPLQDLVLRPGFLAQVNTALDDLAAFVRARGDVAILVGAPLEGADLPYNAAHLIRPDGTRQVVVKEELPNSDVFDERRIFARGTGGTPLVLGEWRLGVMICEDMWHGPVARRLADEGADCLLVINGSPMELGKQAIRHRHAFRRASDTGLGLIYLNLVGGQDEMVFDGSSFAMSAEGQIIAQLDMEEASFDLNLERDQSGHRTVLVPIDPQVHSYPDEMEAIYRGTVMGLRDYVEKNGFREVVLGLSGGLDSAIVAAIATDAIGPERVICVMMPSQYTGLESRDLASEMVSRIGCQYASVPIGATVGEMEQSLDCALTALSGPSIASARKVASENLQARTRGMLLMGISNARPGALVLSTGNKSEMSVGYATLYGDMCGGFNPIKDLYKTKVQQLAAWRNANLPSGMKGCAEPIPEGIISRPPTAELAEGQSDEAALGAYPQLDAVLFSLIEMQMGPVAASGWASRKIDAEVPVEYAERIAGLVKRAEYKRRQAPPGIKLTSRSFGFGWRYPITNRGALA